MMILFFRPLCTTVHGLHQLGISVTSYTYSLRKTSNQDVQLSQIFDKKTPICSSYP